MKKINLLRLAALAILILWGALFWHPSETIAGSNDASRLAVIQSVAEEGVFFIERSSFSTVDKVKRNGHVYSDKPLFLGWSLGVLWHPVHQLTKWSFNGRERRALIGGFNFVFGVALNFLLFCWLLNEFRRIRTGAVWWKAALALGAVITTWYGSYSTMLNNHVPAALAVTGLWVALHKLSIKPTAQAALATGSAAGVVGLLEIPCGAIFGLAAVVGVALIAPQKMRLRFALIAACGGAAALALMFGLNFYAYDSILPLYISHGGTFSFPALFRPQLAEYAQATLFGSRGLFSYHPFLLLALPGVLIVRKTFQRVMLIASTAVIFFYILCTNEFGGWAYGFRYLIPVIPVLWLISGAFLLQKRNSFLNCFAIALALWGLVTSAVGAWNPFCVANEGVRTSKGNFSDAIRSTFDGNLMHILSHVAPESALFRYYVEKYGIENTVKFLRWSAIDLDLPDPAHGIGERRQELLRELEPLLQEKK